MSAPTLEDLLKDIRDSLLDEPCSDVYLTKVSEDLKHLELLRPYLELDEGEEDNIRKTYPSYEVRNQKLLLKWKETFSLSATYRNLVTAIFNSGKVDLAHRACQLIPQYSKHAPRLSPVLAAYKQQLVTGYKTPQPDMVDEWPPPPSLQYIDLALHKKEKIQRGEIKKDEIQEAMHGNIDQFVYKNEVNIVKIEELLRLDSDGRRVILFEGAPGSGKSTLLWHVCQGWQSGELFQQFNLVLLVLLRDTAVHDAQCLANILPYVPFRTSNSVEIRNKYASEIEKVHGEGVLIMLDGWDEAPANLRRKGSLFHDIISAPSKCSIEKAVVVVSSRPSASQGLWSYASARVSVLGFTSEGSENFILESLKNSPEHAQALIEKIYSNPRLSSDCHLPLNLVIITHVFMCSGNTLPSTYCRIIITLALSCLLRHIKKTRPDDGDLVEALNSFSDLPEDMREDFLKLCKIAYDGIVNEKYSFSRQDLKGIALGAQEVTTFSLLQAVHSLIAIGSATVYHFLHLSLQELCAAYHIAALPDPETTHIKAFKKLASTEWGLYHNLCAHFEPVCHFYSALTQLKVSEVIDHLVDMFEDQDCQIYSVLKTGRGKIIKGPILNCLYEAQSSDLMEKVTGRHVELRIQYCYDSFHGEKIASLITLNNNLESLTILGSMPELDRALVGKRCLKSLVFHGSQDHGHGLKVLRMCPNLEYLKINYSGYEHIKMPLKSDLEHHTSLKTLDLSEANVDIVELSSALATNMSIKHLLISCRDIGYSGQEALSKALAQNSSLVTLELIVNMNHAFTGDDHTFFHSLKDGVSLTEVKLSNKSKFYNPCLCLTSVGMALLSGNLVELANILGLNTPSVVDKVLHIHIYHNACIKVDFKSSSFIHLGLIDCEIENQANNLRKLGPNAVRLLISTLNKVTVKSLNLKIQINDRPKEPPIKLEVISSDSSNQASEQRMCLCMCIIAPQYAMYRHPIFGLVQFRVIEELQIAHILNYTSLQYLDISSGDNTFRMSSYENIYSIGEEDMRGLASALRTNNTLKTLILRGNKIGDSGAVQLAKVLNRTSLEVLDVSDCGVMGKGIKFLSFALRTNTSLKMFSACKNRFSDYGAIHLAEALKFASLEYLRVCGCDISKNGIAELSSALRFNTTLKRFSVSDNAFRDSGAIQLAKALNSSSLRELDISRCDVYDSGIVALATALTSNITLTHLDIRLQLHSFLFSQISHSDWIQRCEQLFARALLQNRTLTRLLINNDTYSSPSIRSLHHSDKDNDGKRFMISVTQALLKDTSTSTFYAGIKVSPIISCIEITRDTSLGEALWSGNLEKAAEILQLHQPPAVEKTLTVYMSNNSWTVDYRSSIVLEDDELVKVRNIFSNTGSWSQCTELNFKGKRLGNVGACVLAARLNETQIQELNIGACSIGDEGIVDLSSALSTNTTLKLLAIGGNMITTSGQKALAKALTQNKTLTTLDITGHVKYKDKHSLDILHHRQSISICDSFRDESNPILEKKIDDIMFFQSLKCFSLTHLILDNHCRFGAHLTAHYTKKEDLGKRRNESIHPSHYPHVIVTCRVKPFKVTKIFSIEGQKEVHYDGTKEAAQEDVYDPYDTL